MERVREIKDVALFLKKLFLFIGISLPVFFVADRIYSSAVVNKLDEKPIWILSKKNRQYDYAVIGSSRALNNFSVKDADSLMGTQGINLGISASAFPQNLLCLDWFYKNGNSINMLFVQVDYKGFEPPAKAYTYPIYDFCYFPLLGKSDFADSVFKENTPPAIKYYFRKTIPFFKYAEFNNKYPLFHVLTNFRYMVDRKKNFDNENGTVLLNGNQNSEEADLKSSKEHLLKKKEEFSPAFESEMENTLVEMVKLAGKHNTKVIFFTSPVLAPFNDNPEPLYRRVDSLALKNNVPYYKMMQDSVSGFRTLFFDGGHLNKEGARAFTLRLCKKIISKK